MLLVSGPHPETKPRFGHCTWPSLTNPYSSRLHHHFAARGWLRASTKPENTTLSLIAALPAPPLVRLPVSQFEPLRPAIAPGLPCGTNSIIIVAVENQHNA